MNMRELCAVFCLMIMYTVDAFDAECDVYFIVFEETSCPDHVKLKPLNKPDINWDKVTYPCNSTEKNPAKNICLVEFNCFGTERNCKHNIKIVNHQTHSFIDNRTAKPLTDTTEAVHVLQSNITVDEKPHQTVDEKLNVSTYDVNLIYIKDSVIQDSSKTSIENCSLGCVHAETVCIDGEIPENDSLSDVKNIHTLEIAINRDETSPVQPIFTGYFPESSKDSFKNYKNHFKDFKTGSLSCSSLTYKNCKKNIENKSVLHLNVYIKANCIENNTITKYPDCIENSITSDNVLNLKCGDILFAKHNLHIVQTLPTPSPKLSTWNCQITELETLSSKEQRIENNKIHFNNCSNETNTKQNKYKNMNVTQILDNKTINIYNISTKNRFEMKKTDISTRKEEINRDHKETTTTKSQGNPKNIITILVTEKPNNCSNNTSLNIAEGKIIDLDANSNENKFLQNNILELNLVGCINIDSSISNETQPNSKVELTIILKNESLNDANLKQFNGTMKLGSLKQRILLQCDHHPNLDSNTTVLQCEYIDLDSYNITGIETTTNVSLTSKLHENNTEEKIKTNMKIIQKNHKQTKVNAEVNKNNNLGTNETVEKIEGTVNNHSNENNTKVVRVKEVQKNEDNLFNLNFNRKKDIPIDAGQNVLAQGNPETERILLIALLTVACVAIVILFALRACPNKRMYNPAPTREPPNEEDTAL